MMLYLMTRSMVWIMSAGIFPCCMSMLKKYFVICNEIHVATIIMTAVIMLGNIESANLCKLKIDDMSMANRRIPMKSIRYLISGSIASIIGAGSFLLTRSHVKKCFISRNPMYVTITIVVPISMDCRFNDKIDIKLSNQSAKRKPRLNFMEKVIEA